MVTEGAKWSAMLYYAGKAAEKAAEVAASSAKILAVVKTALGAGEDAKVRAFAASGEWHHLEDHVDTGGGFTPEEYQKRVLSSSMRQRQ